MDYRKKVILFIALLSYFVNAMDGSVVVTGLTRIAHDLQLSQSGLSWIQSGYMLTFGGCMLLGGRLGDSKGRKSVLLAALFIFCVSSIVAGAAMSGPVMIGARLWQGVGAALLAPTSLALLMDTFHGQERMRAVAWYTSVSGLGTSIGLVLGGFIADYASWRLGFFINVPITILMMVLTMQVVTNDGASHKSFDYVGTLLSIGGFIALVYGINGSTEPLRWLVLAFVLLSAFVPMTFCSFLAAITLPVLLRRFGNFKIFFLAGLCLLVGFLWFLPQNMHGAYVNIYLGPLMLLGFGQGFIMSPLTNLGIRDTSGDMAGAASGVVNVAHQLGGAIGLSIMVAANETMPNIIDKFHRSLEISVLFIVVMLVLGIATLRKS
ncbi:MAG: MFS transporter [Veillonella sp.]|nr:MFS transporter [Veillonella sp.]